MKLLIKLFIKDKDNISSPQVRSKYASLSGGLGIVLNIILFGSKLLVGYLSNSISIVADAFNNLSDAGSSIITIIGFRIAKREADEAHPFGHGRSEYISGLVVSIIILYMGIELVRTSLDKIIHPREVIFGAPIVISLTISIVIKFYMYCYNKELAKKLKTPAFSAVATDSISDVFTTLAVLISSIVAHLSGINIDGFTGVMVGIIIIKGGVDAFKDTTGSLMGMAPEHEILDEIKSLAKRYDCIVGIHDFMVHDYGPERRIITFHAEVPAEGDIIALHDSIDNLERLINRKLNAQTVIHMDPIFTNDEETNRLKEKVLDMGRELCNETSVHDFRIVKGHTHTNLIFDVVLPFSCKIPPDEFRRQLSGRIRQDNPEYYIVITVDRE